MYNVKPTYGFIVLVSQRSKRSKLLMEMIIYGRNGITESIVLMDEEELKEWVAQVELGLLFTFVSMPEGGNDLMQIFFRLFGTHSLCNDAG
ncbi:hypothetical protein C5167_044958 [Papaver somniferum]|uniref:Uncharacterized protein n=1 Tax=Papaver somniferum TaxID=3469 RepID=A0A4Y7LD19_PAPSO|nr:hypothetical protein C5167_044958 [Papaver somniferum]